MRIALLLFLMTFQLLAQEKIVLNGRVKLQHTTFTETTIYNVTQNAYWNTDQSGRFSVRVALGDVLIFMHPEAFEQTIEITKPILARNFLDVQLISNHTLMKEMTIVTADSLQNALFGSRLPHPSQAERADRVNKNIVTLPEHGGISINVDGIVNKLSGRAKMVKNWMRYEHDEKNYRQFTAIYSVSYFVTHFGLKEELVPFFIYSLIAEEGFTIESVKKNKPYEYFLTQKMETFKKENSYSAFSL